MRHVLLFVLITALLRADARADETLSFLDNGKVRLGVDLRLGGAITFLARDGGENVINRVEVTGLRPSPLPHHPACGAAPGGSNQTNG